MLDNSGDLALSMNMPQKLVERIFSVLEKIMEAENIWYTRNRNYDATIGMKTICL
jgi:hypothetical protein